VSASLELTAYQLLLVGDKARPALGSFHFRLDNADVLVSFTSEAARIDHQLRAQRDAGLIYSQGSVPISRPPGNMPTGIVGWRTRPTANCRQRRRGALWRRGPCLFSTASACFTHVNELSLVLGMTPVLIDRALPFVTVFSGSSNVDVLIAAARDHRRIARHDAFRSERFPEPAAGVDERLTCGRSCTWPGAGQCDDPHKYHPFAS